MSRSATTRAFALGGAVAGAMAVGLGAVAIGQARFNRMVAGEVEALFAEAHREGRTLVTEAMLETVPTPIRDYLTYAGVVGTPIPGTVRLRQVGRIRETAEAEWLPFEARQWYSTQPPGFVWDASVKRGPVTIARARDRYADGEGTMYIRAAGLYPIADARGAEMDQGAMLRYLQEMIAWFPAALLRNYVAFEELDERTVRVTLRDGGRSVGGVLSVGEDGRYEDFVADRYRTVGDQYELETWSTPLREYGTANGLRLGLGGSGIWKLEEGDLTYIELRVTELEYDVTGP